MTSTRRGRAVDRLAVLGIKQLSDRREERRL